MFRAFWNEVITVAKITCPMGDVQRPVVHLLCWIDGGNIGLSVPAGDGPDFRFAIGGQIVRGGELRRTILVGHPVMDGDAVIGQHQQVDPLVLI